MFRGSVISINSREGNVILPFFSGEGGVGVVESMEIISKRSRKDNIRSPKLAVAFCNAKQLEFSSHTLPSFQDKSSK